MHIDDRQTVLAVYKYGQEDRNYESESNSFTHVDPL